MSVRLLRSRKKHSTSDDQQLDAGGQWSSFAGQLKRAWQGSGWPSRRIVVTAAILGVALILLGIPLLAGGEGMGDGLRAIYSRKYKVRETHPSMERVEIVTSVDVCFG